MKKLVSSILILGSLLTACSKSDDSPAPEEKITVSSFSPTSGIKESSVTITGKNFGTDTADVKVYFNEKEATISNLTNTQITVTVPVKALTGTLKVKKNDTTVAAGTFTYQYSKATVSTFATLTANPFGIAIDGKDAIYTSLSNRKIVKLNANGTATDYIGDGTNAYQLGTGTATSTGIVYNFTADKDGTLYLPLYSFNRITKVSPTGVMTFFAGSGSNKSTNGTGALASFSRPIGAGTDGNGNVYVCDYGTHAIRKITSAGVVTTIAGGFRNPFDVEVDSKGNLFVADDLNNCIKKITPAGVVTTFAGSTIRFTGTTNGTGTAARFHSPIGIVIDKNDHIFVADYNNHRIREITPAGVVTTLAGNGRQGSINGDATTASFNRPRDLVIDSKGDLYVTDYSNRQVRKITRE